MPTLSGLTASVTFGENTVNAAPQIIDSDVAVTDAAGNFNGGRLTVSGHFAGDSIAIRDQGTGAGQVGFAGGTITYGGTAIGTATGGAAGSAMLVTFNANATTAAVEAVIENLTYANSNNVNPATSRTLNILLTDGNGDGDYIVQAGTANPLDGVDVGFRSAPAFGDLDGDGDLDMVSGNSYGSFNYFKNTGTSTSPVFTEQTGGANPLNGADVGLGSTPVLVDLDGDGDLDLVAGENDGNLNTYKNTGTSSAPVFVLQSGASDPFDGIDPSSFSKPAFADLDGDGDKDMLFGLTGGTVLYYQNTGTASAPAFSQGSISGLADVGSYSAPALGDVDGDGDTDLVVGDSTGAIHYFENIGTTSSPALVERTGTLDPFEDATGAGAVTLVDIDKDGDLDLVTGASGGTFAVALNATSHVRVNVFTENDAPVAESANFAVGEGGELSSTVIATDVDGSIATYVLDTTTAKGTVDFFDDGSFVFDAGSDFEALDAGETEQVTFTYHAVDDRGASSTVQTVTITVTGVNDLPELSGMTASQGFAENTVNATPQVIDSSVTLTDPEGDFGGGSLTVSGLLSEDTVAIANQGSGAGQIGFSGGNVSYGGVVIGTASGGNGVDLVVNFNANATTAAVEALVENFTYANSSDAPTATRTLAIKIADASGGVLPILDAQTGAANPFAGIDTGEWNAPALGDLDGDGDLDLVVGTAGGGFRTYINTGTESSPAYAETTGSANPLNGIDVGGYGSPALADLDGDGDLDLVAGGYNGALHFFENTGTGAAPAFVERTGAANPFAAVDVAGGTASASFGDLDGDGDLDLAVSGARDIAYFENIGSPGDPIFTAKVGSENPFAGIDPRGLVGAPISLGDLDSDGDLDLATTTEFYGIEYYQNVGTGTDLAFTVVTGGDNPFYGVAYGALGPAPGEINVNRGAVALADLDGDGDVDAVLAGSVGVGYAKNTGTEVVVTVTAENDAPVASADSETTAADVVLAGSVPAASDADNAIASYMLDTSVATGRLTFNADGSYTYSPDAQFGGLLPGESAGVTFTYHAVDASGAESNVATATITVTGVDRAPLITEVATAATFAENIVNAGGQVIDAGIRLIDREGDFTGGTLTVAGLLAEDTVSIANQGSGAVQIGLSGANVTYGGVVIGTVAGGAGASLVVTFNADASTAAVEALIEHITYANGSDAPTTSRTLSLTLTDTDGNAARSYGFAERTGGDNPVDFSPGQLQKPVFADLDHDGDLDMVTGRIEGTLSYFENTGAATDPVFAQRTSTANPFNGIDIGDNSAPTLGDLDDDGDLDLVVGTSAGTFVYYKNTGTAAAPTFTLQSGAANPMNGVDLPSSSEPTLVDLDGDGDLDLAVGTGNGSIQFFKNTGTASAPVLAQQSGASNPFDGIDVGNAATPAFADLDEDGDLDLVVGESDGVLNTFENTGSVSAPAFTQRSGEANPLASIGDVGSASAPALVDIDGDGDLDVVIGQQNIAPIVTFENTGPTTQTITVTVTAVNDAPAGADSDSVTTEGAVLAGSVTATDPDGTIASYLLDSGVAKGTLTFNGDGSWSFDPGGAFQALAPGETEDVTFTWHAVDDGGAATGVHTVTITVAGTVPSIEGLAASVTFTEGAVNAGPQLLDADIALLEASGSFDGGALTVSGLVAEDIVSVRNQGTAAGEIGLAGDTLTYGGVAIGTAAGGSGASLVVTFNGSATPEAIEALVENLTYANASDSPTASRALTLTIDDGTTGFHEAAGAADPFAGIDPGSYSAPALADLDGDGDLDLIVGSSEGLAYFENTGSAEAPAFTARTGGANPFDALVAGGQNATPALVDIDDDGDLDLIVGTYTTPVTYFENAGTATDPTFTPVALASSPFAGVTPGVGKDYNAPTFADIDGDGDSDLVIGTKDGTLHVYENAGTASAGAFLERTGADSPFDGIAVLAHAKPAFADLDGDGDLDLVVGAIDGTVHAYENLGGPTLPVFTELTGATNPLAGANVASSFGYSAPALADLDGDGALDAIVGSYQGDISFLVGTPPARSEISVNVTAENDAPVASDDSATTGEGSVLSASVPAASDVDGTIAGYAVVSDVAKGVLTFNADGSYSFDPHGDFEMLGTGESDAVTFTYKAIDNDGGESTAKTVTITVTGVNDAPQLHDLVHAVNVAENTVNATPQLIDAEVGLVDPEGNFDGGAVSVSGLLSEDVVAIRDQGTGAGEIGFAGGIVTYGGVPIGTATGGDGDTFAVILNGSATTEAVDALIQNLTYTSISDTPTGSRTLTIAVVDGEGASTPTGPLVSQTGTANPFAGIDVGNYSAPAFADIDGDHDLDLVVGTGGGSLRSFENTGAGFVELTGADNPFSAANIPSSYAMPTVVDLDGDGDLDLVVGAGEGELYAFENTGSGFIALAGPDNPLEGIDAGQFSAPAFGDFDGDGDEDMAVGNFGGGIAYYENTGTAAAPVFVERSGADNPFDGIDVGNRSTLAASDVDGDGDLDVLIGERDGDLVYVENAGTAASPDFVRTYGSDNPFASFATGSASYAAPVFADVDGDGDRDLVIGHDGELAFIAASPDTRVTIKVTAENDIPVAANDSTSTGEGSMLTASVPAASDVDGTIARYALVSDVAKGALTLNSDGSYNYDPDGDFEGLGTGDSEQVTFTYKAIDNDGGASAVKTVSITVTGVNDLPVASDTDATTDEDSVLTTSVPAASDVDGTIAGYALVSDVAKGALTFDADGAYSYDPDGDFEGLGTGDSEQVTFTYKAIDNDGGASAVKTVTITVTGVDETGGGTNDAPEITSPGTFTIIENSSAVGRVTASDSDGTPTFSIVGGADALLFAIDSSTGVLSFRASPDFEGPADADGNNVYDLVVGASDGSAGDTAAISVTVANESGVGISGSKKKDVVDAGNTVKGGVLPTGEEDEIVGNGKNDKLSGVGGDDLIDGGKGKDKLWGGDGGDWLAGGKSNDKLNGGGGADSFVFNQKLKANVDKVVDFAPGADRIVLDDKVFKALAAGPLSADAFVFGRKAKDADDRVLYDARKGVLLYDADGKGGKDAAVFAKIGKGLDLDAGDFLVI